MSFGIGLLIASVAVGAAGAVHSSRQTRKAERAQRRMEARSAQRERIQQLRQQQAAQAELKARAVATGVADGSGVSGGLSSIGASTAGNLSFQQQQFSTAGHIQNFQSSANRRLMNANIVSSVLRTGAMVSEMYYNQPVAQSGTSAQGSQGLSGPAGGLEPEELQAGFGRYRPIKISGWGR